MASSAPTPSNVRLRYSAIRVFAQADTHAPAVAQLAQGDPFTVQGAEGQFYRVRLADGIEGFVWAQNVTGTDMPLTATEQQEVDERAALAAQSPRGWRGLLHRLQGRR